MKNNKNMCQLMTLRFFLLLTYVTFLYADQSVGKSLNQIYFNFNPNCFLSALIYIYFNFFFSAEASNDRCGGKIFKIVINAVANTGAIVWIWFNSYEHGIHTGYRPLIKPLIVAYYNSYWLDIRSINCHKYPYNFDIVTFKKPSSSFAGKSMKKSLRLTITFRN